LKNLISIKQKTINTVKLKEKNHKNNPNEKSHENKSVHQVRTSSLEEISLLYMNEFYPFFIKLTNKFKLSIYL